MKFWKDYDWSDIIPSPIPQNTQYLAQIAYAPEFTEAMSIFRAVHAEREVSERVIALTTAIIEMNPAHYSVWDYRFEVVSEIGNDVFDYKEVGLVPSSPQPPKVGEDGVWLNQFTLSHSKNYQVWNYRQQIADSNNILWYRGERVILDMVFEDESKNFHAWSYYKWIIQLSQKYCPAAFDPESLLAETEKQLDSDVLNNSVWSFRYFVLHAFKQLRNDKDELKFVARQIAIRPGNESAWSYLRGYVNDLGLPESMERAKILARDYLDEPRAVETLAELSHADEASPLWHRLGSMEPIRQQFWESRV